MVCSSGISRLLSGILKGLALEAVELVMEALPLLRGDVEW